MGQQFSRALRAGWRPWVGSAVVAALMVGSVATPARATAGVGTASGGRHSASVVWSPCPQAPAAQCGTLSLPVDWARPDGPRFDLAVARRTATDPSARIGSLVFGPGGPGDSGVQRITTGMNRFSTELQRRFDIVSFDPRGIGASSPVRCSTELLASQPSPLITSATEFAATRAFNRRLSRNCRFHTGPLYDHLDTASLVRDLDALRAALGERRLTFHGSSYGTLLGEQYAERYPGRVRALVLEGVVDHSLGTREFLDTQAVTEEASFDEFAAWCDRTSACALNGTDVHAVWADLLARAGRGELFDPEHPGTRLTPFTLTVLAQRAFYDPRWAPLARTLADLNSPSESKTVAREEDLDEPTQAYSFAPFCEDWNLPVRNYREYARHLERIAASAPDMKYPRALLAVSACLGSTQPVNNPQHRLRVPDARKILLTNAVYDPASGYNWALNVTRQLGDRAVLLTYDGWGHGTYNSTPCARAAVDRYLITLVRPAPGTHCPAIEPPPS